jgi:hypothetical protein
MLNEMAAERVLKPMFFAWSIKNITTSYRGSPEKPRGRQRLLFCTNQRTGGHRSTMFSRRFMG